MPNRISTPSGSVIINPGDHEHNMLERVFGGPTTPQFHNSRIPPVDLVELEDKFLVMMDLQGLPRENLEVHVDGDTLVVSGDATQFEPEGARWIIHERRHGRYVRSISLGAHVDKDSIDANYTDGILSLTLPKAKPGKSTARAIPLD